MSLIKSHSRSTNMSQQLCALTLMALILGYGTFAAPQLVMGPVNQAKEIGYIKENQAFLGLKSEEIPPLPQPRLKLTLLQEHHMDWRECGRHLGPSRLHGPAWERV